MGLDNRPANRQPHPHAERFGRKQWIEYPINSARLDTLPRVFHRHHHTAGVVDFRPYAKYPLPILSDHGIDRVRDQIHQHLVQLNLVAFYQRQRFVAVGLNGYPMRLQVVV